MSPWYRRIALVVVCAGILACWVIPYHLAFGPRGSYYTFAFVGDEYYYATRIQSPISGTTATNPVNGITDPSVVSPFYLDDLFRTLARCSHLHAITFFWIYRIVFPILMAALCIWASFECLPRTRPPFSTVLRYCAAGLILPMLYLVYDVAITYPPNGGFIHRIPTNIEYPLSILFAIFLVRFVSSPTTNRALGVAAGSILLLYLRIYTAIPWAITTLLILLVLAIFKRESMRACVVLFLTVLIGAIPWLLVTQHNARSTTYQQLIVRYFPKWPFTLHALTTQYLIIACILAAATYGVNRKQRPLIGGMAAATATLPFISSLLPFANELMLFDRYSAFYLVALAITFLLLIGEKSRGWKGRAGNNAAARWTLILGGGATLLTAILLFRNWQVNFLEYPNKHYASVAWDGQYLKAYEWVRDHTAEDALFLVDDGFDWSRLNSKDASPVLRKKQILNNDNLFQIVARRRVVNSPRLEVQVISNEDLAMLNLLHTATFGGSATDQDYQRALQRFQPQYVFWRKVAPTPFLDQPLTIPRGQGTSLKGFATTIYSDESCEIWKLNDAR